MKWVEIFGTHTNTDLIETFAWFDGELQLKFVADPKIVKLDDPDRKIYIKLCHQLGVRPCEEVQE